MAAIHLLFLISILSPATGVSTPSFTVLSPAPDKLCNSQVLLAGAANLATRDTTPVTTQSTLFLFDLSGSMNANGSGAVPKLAQAKAAGGVTLDDLPTAAEGVRNQVAVLGFRGDCRPDPTVLVSDFVEDVGEVRRRIDGMAAGGGTPMAAALRVAECRLAEHLAASAQTRGKLILLSDGQATCGAIRPADVYHAAPLNATQTYTVDAGQCGATFAGRPRIRNYTIGFDIAPGSPAERDLQYLSARSGGKYLNVQNQAELTRAFRKFNRVYRPKPTPALAGLPPAERSAFRGGVEEITSENFTVALKTVADWASRNPTDCHGTFNHALMLEANDLYREAADAYGLYLQTCPAATDAAAVRERIDRLEAEFATFLRFQADVVRSDADFLKLHFERMQHQQSRKLAGEFAAFLREKGVYYQDLPRLIATDDRFTTRLAADVARALQRSARMIDDRPENWDRDGGPVISMTYRNLSQLAERL